jgi:mannose-6-phosphate isomerase-like protein (cupin superfamily)
MFVKKELAQSFSIQGGTNGAIYPSSPKGDQTIAVVEMDGVYPSDGYSVNDFCTETIFMLEGKFELEAEGKKYQLESGDLFMILPGVKYRIVGKGKSMDFISPAWDKSQNHIIKS